METDISIVEQIFEVLQKEYKNMGHVNIIVAGKTGVGKSTLINAVFGKKVAQTGTGRPVTQELKEITLRNYPLRIYDTVGLELNQEQQRRVKEDIIKLVNQKRCSEEIDKQIHCIWYCVNSLSSRFEAEEENFVKSLAIDVDIPVIVIVTQSFGKKAENLQKYIDECNMPISKTFCVLAEDYQIDEDYTKKAFGCKELVDYVAEILPESAQKAFINVQTASIETKRKKAQLIIKGVAAATFGESFIPLPFADTVALIPTEISMIAAITATYGMEVKRSTMTAIISSLLGSTVVTIAGNTIVSAILRSIPGIGTVASGAISGGIATILTIALGETYIAIMEQMLRGEVTEKQLENKEYLENYSRQFKENMKHADKYKKEYYLTVNFIV